MKGFLWRRNERPETFEDLFENDDGEKSNIPEVTIYQRMKELQRDFLKYQAKTTPFPLGIEIDHAKGSYVYDTMVNRI